MCPLPDPKEVEQLRRQASRVMQGAVAMAVAGTVACAWLLWRTGS